MKNIRIIHSMLTTLSLLFTLSAVANMYSPIEEGSTGASPFVSQHVDIIKEHILIVPDNHFQNAQFFIEYHIDAKMAGSQIPLLFYASEYTDGFKIWLDDREIDLNPVPDRYQNMDGDPFNDFSYIFNSPEAGDNGYIDLGGDQTQWLSVNIDELKFFEVDLSEGEHIIRVEYIAERWIDHSEWVNEYSFRYILSPARYWKSFGTLEITIDASDFQSILNTNLGTPAKGTLLSQASWTFTELPLDVLQIIYQPEIHSCAKTMIAISPTGLTIIFGIILMLIHLLLVWLYRRKNPGNKYSWVVIAGSILIPFITLIGYMMSFGIIDSCIGPDAGHYHGYPFLILLLYPIILPLYWLIMWLFDRLIKRKL